jgi:two-component sensor histidine kinase
MLGFPGIENASVEDAMARVHREDLPTVRAQFYGALRGEGGGHLKMDFRFVRPGGEVRWMSWVGQVEFRDEGGGLAPGRIVGACQDITERKMQEERVTLLMREVNHRFKNMLTVVQAIARQTAANTAEDFARRFGERIQALSASQDLLVMNLWRGVPLDELARAQLALFEDLIGARIKLSGPRLVITAAASQAIGMALHELATNAGKHGALSSEEGRVKVEWGLESSGAGEKTFAMSWREEDGPTVSPPSREGFGTTVIRRIVQQSLDAKVELNFPPEGLAWRLRCPASHVIDGGRS